MHGNTPSQLGNLGIFDQSHWFGSVDDTGALAVIALAFVVGGLVKGLIGGGLPSVVVPIMAMVIEPVLAATLTLVPVIATNVWQVLDGRLLLPVLRRFWVFILMLFLGVAAGTQILIGLPGQTAALMIGMVVVCVSPIPVLTHRFHVSERRETFLNPVMGGAIGLLGGTTVIFTPALIYLSMLRLDKNLYVSVAAVTAICSMVPLYLGLGYSSELTWDTVRFSVVLLMPTAIGFLAGRALRDAVSQQVFRLILTTSLVLIGVALIFKGLI